MAQYQRIAPRLSFLAGPLLLIGPLCVGFASAQEEPRNLFDKAPPDVEQALRARVAKFYQLFVDGKPRLAEPLVAEESKDIFFAAEKKKYKSCDMGSVTYSDNFTKAKAVVSCDTSYFAMGRPIAVKIPITSLWKLRDGEWYWYVIPPNELSEYNTPVGPAKRPPEEEGGDNATPPAPMVRPMITADQLQKAVRADHESFDFNSSKSSQQDLRVKNSLPGGVTLTASTAVAGLSVKPAKTGIQAGEELTFVVAFDPEDPKVVCASCLSHPQDRLAGEVTLRVEPTGQVISIQIRFIVPPSAAK